METAHKRSFFVGVALLSVIFVAAKLLFFALPWAAELGNWVAVFFGNWSSPSIFSWATV